MINAVIIDTLTATQTNEWLSMEKKPNHDKWMDMGKSIFEFCTFLEGAGFELIFILGNPGTGKSCGIRTLDPDKTIFINADKKNPTWTGGREIYGLKSNPKLPHHFIPTSYESIINHLKKIGERIGFEEKRYAFLTAHIEEYKSGVETCQRLKTIGKMSSKYQLEAKAENVFYTRVKKTEEGTSYILETENNGYNTARSIMSVFPPEIPNDYQLIIDTLNNF